MNAARPRCECHDVPMHRRKDVRSGWRCAVKHCADSARYRATEEGRASEARSYARTNARRIFVGRTYIGTENLYPAPREAVAQFARELIEQHKKEAHGTDG